VTAPLPAETRTRLVKLLGMLGSDFAGERAAAGQMADQLVRGLGLTWGDVVAQKERPPVGIGSFWRPRPWKLSHQALALTCLDTAYPWTDWERAFLTTLTWSRRLSPKQETILRRLCGCVGLEDAL
jgi:hypothetical protein